MVVPSSYRPKSGALFKARALQYCLEEDVNLLADTDWIVHLDEETLATEAAIRGILNFVIEGRHQFGQVSVYAEFLCNASLLPPNSSEDFLLKDSTLSQKTVISLLDGARTTYIQLWPVAYHIIY